MNAFCASENFDAFIAIPLLSQPGKRSGKLQSQTVQIAGIRSTDNGPEFVAKAVRDWIAAVGARSAHIEPESPWENGYCESSNSKFRDEPINGEIFLSLAEAKIIIKSWRRHYNTKRPNSTLGYRPPVPDVIQWPALPSGATSPATPAVAPRPVEHYDRNCTTREGRAIVH
jgi:transposase InsO family protein